MERPEDAAGQNPPLELKEAPELAADPAEQSLVSALRSSFAVLRLIMLVLFVLYACSGVFRIQPGEQGIIARFGKLVLNQKTGTPVFDKGWIWWALPDPLDEKIRLSGSIHRLEIDTFLFRRNPKDVEDRTDIATLRSMGALKPGVDGAMLTGDKNLSHGLWEVEYKVVDAARFVTTVGERPAHFEPLLQRLFENAILREVAYHKVEEVTRLRLDTLVNGVAARLQRELDQLSVVPTDDPSRRGVGVAIVKINAQTIVPAKVAPAFTEVTRAENQKKQQEDAAGQRATEILNQAAGPQHEELLQKIREYGAAQLTGADSQRLEQMRAAIDAKLDEAQGNVAVMLRDAQAEANTVREQISREYEEFTRWLEQYRRFPAPTAILLWTQMRHEVLGSKDNELFWVPHSDIIEILVNRDPNKAIEAERERLRLDMEESR